MEVAGNTASRVSPLNNYVIKLLIVFAYYNDWLINYCNSSGKPKQRLYQQAKQHTGSYCVLLMMLKLIWNLLPIPIEDDLLEFKLLG